VRRRGRRPDDDDERFGEDRVGGYYKSVGNIEESGRRNGDESCWRGREVGSRGSRRWERDEYLASPLQSRSRFVPVMDGAFMVERSETLLERLRGQGY